MIYRWWQRFLWRIWYPLTKPRYDPDDPKWHMAAEEEDTFWDVLEEEDGKPLSLE